MLLSSTTFDVLKNFATINGNLYISGGDEIKTVNDSQTVFAEAKIPDVIPVEVGIYDLTEFLSICSLVGDPTTVDFEFTDKYVLLKGGNAKVKYWYASKNVLKFPEKNINMPEPLAEFEVSAEPFSRVRRAAGVFGHPAISVYHDSSDGLVMGKAYDPDISTSNVFEEQFEVVPDDVPVFDYIFSVVNLKYLSESSGYDVSLAAKGKSKIAKFVSKTQPISYYIAVDQRSTVQE